jgi:RES domain-containing protein
MPTDVRRAAARVLHEGLRELQPGRVRLWRVTVSKDCWEVGDSDGRWSLAHDPIVYASTTAGLATLEALAHLKSSDARKPHRLACLDLPVARGAAQWLDLAALPADWKRRRRLTQEIGRQWLAAGQSVLLLIPSALVAGEQNALINATAPVWQRWCRRSRDAAFRIDGRLVPARARS